MSCIRSLKNKYKILAGKPEVQNHLEDLGVNSCLILIRSLRSVYDDVDWVHVTQAWAQVRLFLKEVMENRVHEGHEGLCSIHLIM